PAATIKLPKPQASIKYSRQFLIQLATRYSLLATQPLVIQVTTSRDKTLFKFIKIKPKKSC
ncbi:MAG: hypothetical protein QNJ53_04080, partial [Pleurocapsa sp. MO_192.B19]|nr:hypothetical protein [Pleurocapsa sp. MO_192.B19]